MKKKIIAYVFAYILVMSVITYFEYSRYNTLGPIEVSHQLEYLPTDDVSLTSKVGGAESFELPFDQFKKLSFEGATYIVFSQNLDTVKVNATALSSGVIFHTVIDEIEIPTVVMGKIFLTRYEIVDKKITDGTIILSLTPDDSEFLMLNIVVWVVTGLSACLFGMIYTVRHMIKRGTLTWEET
jgi:hypothetical protein